MKSVSNHPLNPCSFGNAAKYWELLRRNPDFRRRAARLCELAAIARSPKGQSVGRYYGVVEHLKDAVSNRRLGKPAATALAWLIPEPTFYFTCKDGRIGEGVTPDLESLTWHHPRGHAGWLSRMGPEIRWYEGGEDLFSDWKKHLAAHGQFSYEHHWNQTPMAFWHQFEFQWRQIEAKAGNIPAHLKPYVTNFFHDWSLTGLIKRYYDAVKNAKRDVDGKGAPDTVRMTTQGNKLITKHYGFSYEVSRTEHARAIEFNSLRDEYHVFCFPKTIRLSPKAIHGVFEKWADLVEKDIGTSNEIILGSPTEWDVYLHATDYIERSGVGSVAHRKGLRYAFDQIFSNLTEQQRDTRWRKQQPNYFRHYATIEHGIALAYGCQDPTPLLRKLSPA